MQTGMRTMNNECHVFDKYASRQKLNIVKPYCQPWYIQEAETLALHTMRTGVQNNSAIC